MNANEQTCSTCGAQIVFEAGKQSLTCPYCGASNRIERPEDALETSFERIVPIAVSQQDLDKRAYIYMASGDFTPDDMIEASTIITRERFYVPAFGFEIDYEAHWTASFGYNRREPYTDYRSVTRGNRTYQEAYTAYRTVTDWRPANGVDAGIFSVAGYAGCRLKGVPNQPRLLVAEAVIDGDSTEFNPSFTTGFDVEGFSESEKNVFDSLQGEIGDEIGERVKSHAQGDSQRDWHWTIPRMNYETTTFAAPICHVVFQYKDAEYNVWVAGHDASSIRADELPVDQDKAKQANIGLWPGALGVLMVIGSAYFWGFAWESLILPGIALGYGFLRRSALIDYSKSIRSSLLTQMLASNQANIEMSEGEQARVARAFQRPERPFFAKIHKDKIVLPALAVVAVIGGIVPNYLSRPERYSITQKASREFAQQQREAEKRAAQEREFAQQRREAEERAAQEREFAQQQREAEERAAQERKSAESQATQDAAEVKTAEARGDESGKETGSSTTKFESPLRTNADDPKVVFELKSVEDDTDCFVETITAKAAAGGTLAVLEAKSISGEYASCSDRKSLQLIVEDMDFDTYNDIRIPGYVGDAGIYYVVWLFDAQKNTYRYSPDLSEIPNLTVDVKNKWITESANISDFDDNSRYKESYYRWVDGKLALFWEETTDRNKNEAVIRALKDGKMVVVETRRLGPNVK
ncbi:MAG: hypothetical protein LBR88_04435 [Zoogloeaceae bacterium]|jgi:predicted RNA-binding Zn-ribbon protein involved in translation (DUF1610 family)|nr:hypothetical protein [Zoogloeaceae bacterium]